jgi:hypothetical protein
MPQAVWHRSCGAQPCLGDISDLPLDGKKSSLEPGLSPLEFFFFKNDPKNACQAPKPHNPFRINNIQVA